MKTRRGRKRGPKRRFNPNIPDHIDQGDLPDNVNWDKGRKAWFVSHYTEGGARTRTKLAGRHATNKQLRELNDSFNEIQTDTFRYVCEKYFDSEKFTNLSKASKNGYKQDFDRLASQRTKVPKTKFADLPLHYVTAVVVQRLIDRMAREHGPTAAKHSHSFMRLVFNWALKRGYAKLNPAIGTDLPKTPPRKHYATDADYETVIRYAKENGSHGQVRKGGCAWYIWPMMELEYLLRGRNVEIRSLTDADVLDNGILMERRKGSDTNLIKWNPRLKEVVRYAQNERDKIWQRKKKPYPLDPEKRPLLVNRVGNKLTKSAYTSATSSLMRRLIKMEIIRPEQRFTNHDLKRKGVTDTKGDKREKLNAAGIKSDALSGTYDVGLHEYDPATDKTI